MKDDTPHKPPIGLSLEIIRRGEKYTGHFPTRLMMPTSDPASDRKCAAIMESIRSRLDKKEQSSTKGNRLIVGDACWACTDPQE